MDDELKTRADRRLDAALAGADRRDPRPFYRRALRHLRERDPDAFQHALEHFETELLPAVAGDADPLAAWLEYGLRIGRALGEGRVMELDGSGRAAAVDDPATAGGLVLHIPDDAGTPVVVLRYPTDATAAQHAAYELLVEGRQSASAYG